MHMDQAGYSPLSHGHHDDTFMSIDDADTVNPLSVTHQLHKYIVQESSSRILCRQFRASAVGAIVSHQVLRFCREMAAAAGEVCYTGCCNIVPKFHLGYKLKDVRVVKQKPCSSNQLEKIWWRASKSSLERITPGSRESSSVVVRALVENIDDDEREPGTEMDCSECSDEVCSLPTTWPPTPEETSTANVLRASDLTADKKESGKPTPQVGEKRSLYVIVLHPEVSLTANLEIGSAPQTLSPDLSHLAMADSGGSVEAPTDKTVKLIAAQNVLQHFKQIELNTIAHNLPSQLPKVRINGGLDQDGFVYAEKFVIRCYEVGTKKTATIEAIASLLQECACNHAQCVGFSTDGFATTPAMRKRHLIWVTTRMHIVMDEYPVWGQMIQIDTWYQGEARMRTRRDWLIKDENGRIIGRASSIWLMLNADTRRPSKIPDDARAEYMAFVPVPPRWAVPEEDHRAVKKIPTLEKYQYKKSPLLVKSSDLDMNQHVNNVTFIGWILESVPEDITSSHELHSLILDYKRECQHDDVVESLGSPVEDLVYSRPKQFATSSERNQEAHDAAASPQAAVHSKVYIHVLRLIDGAEINRGMTTWKKPNA